MGASKRDFEKVLSGVNKFKKFYGKHITHVKSSFFVGGSTAKKEFLGSDKEFLDKLMSSFVH